jgi:hypothetical protein
VLAARARHRRLPALPEVIPRLLSGRPCFFLCPLRFSVASAFQLFLLSLQRWKDLGTEFLSHRGTPMNTDPGLIRSANS